MVSPIPAEALQLEQRALQATRAGRAQEALQAWQRLLQLDPAHPRALDAVGEDAFRRGDLAVAGQCYEKLVAVDGRDTQQWVNLAIVRQRLGDERGEEEALRSALSVDAMDLLALLLRGQLFERQGRMHEAAQAYGAAAAVAPPMERLHPDLRPSVTKAIAYHEGYGTRLAEFLDGHLSTQLQAHSGEDLRRFRDSLDIFIGRKRRFDSQPTVYHVPHLAPIEFFPRGRFAWLDGIESETAAIRDEFLAVLRDDNGFAPYITYPGDVPLNQWAELNQSPRWSAFHLVKMGSRVEDNAARCPRTMAALSRAPQPVMPGRTPSAMFSLLKPKTRIPPHTGVTNARLVVHLPLVVPQACGFRVGNDTRAWLPGKAWVFDDTIEHEAWNDSDKLRTVLIFDIWHPDLTQAERELIGATMAGIAAFRGAGESFQL
jgi:aspartyl/asparaginyl beta-hydroxylase (cupin superfamily)/cytochrome c-type biogenesis protein CcmH/NrfG